MDSFSIGWIVLALGLACIFASAIIAHCESRKKSNLFLKLLSAGLIAIAPIAFWYGETVLSEQRASNVLLDFSVDTTTKVLTISNKGSVDVSDVAIFLTRYVFTGNYDSIDSFSKIGGGPTHGAIWSQPILAAPSHADVDFPNLFSNKEFMPFYDGFPNIPDIALQTDYVVRIRFTNANTHKRMIKYVFVGDIKKMPSIFDTTNSEGGGYKSGMKILKLRNAIIENQLLLFDDDRSSLYQN